MSKTIRIPVDRIEELAGDLGDIAAGLASLSAKLRQVTAELPGAKPMDVPGCKPRFRARKTGPSMSAGIDAPGGARAPTAEARAPGSTGT